jgi:YHS domain-containing protein
VAYCTGKAAATGQPTIHHTHDGVKYYFNTTANRDAFMASPQRYMPAYGGWCAIAMAKGEKVEIEPKNFKVTNDRLFLFFNAWYGDTKKAWVKDEPTQITLADTNWKKISGEN